MSQIAFSFGSEPKTKDNALVLSSHFDSIKTFYQIKPLNNCKTGAKAVAN
jgi:hypothetical protein